MLDTFHYSSSPFISVLASLLGVLLGFFLNNLSRRGRIKIFQNNISIYYFEREPSGGFSHQKEMTDKTEIVEILLNLDFYNTSNYTRKIARDVKINIINQKSNFKLRLKNNETTKVMAGMIHKDDLKNINLLPNELMNLSISFGVNENFDEFKNSPWELVYYNENNKLVKVKINKEQLFAENK
jgi:hypothetical protein